MDQRQQEDQQRRTFSFGLTLLMVWLGWMIAGPILFPGLFPQKEPEKQTSKETPDEDEVADKDEKAEKPKPFFEGIPRSTVTLGSSDPKSGYGLSVELTSVGAAIRSASLTDERYRNADRVHRKGELPPLQLVGSNVPADSKIEALNRDRKPLTFDLAIDRIDKQLKKLDRAASLKTINWKLVGTKKDPESAEITSEATFVARIPDKLEITKKYQLSRISTDKLKEIGIQDRDPAAYTLNLSLKIVNLAKDDSEITYTLQGPVGLPLENADIARKYRDIKAGFVNGEKVGAQTLTASEIVKASEKGTIEEWTKPIRYMGVDLQYFAALVIPTEPQGENPYFARIRPMVVEKNKDKREYSDISVEFQSQNLELATDDPVHHQFKLYLGPKREELLAEFEAGQVFDYGWFGSISHLMVRLLRAFHSWGVPFGFAIIMLTACVRILMFPLSKKQAVSGKKMKELQPLLNELKEKYKDDKQGMAAAQMELYRKANFNPFGGCLLVFIQLPIFISLYQAISNCIDLRLASFLYIRDLSSMDSLFEFPFALPWFGVDFNLLPLITMVLYYLQQKLFMPPPANEEAAMQMKVMNFMMIFMGLLFYHVPAGLCVYFIASSLWSMGERKVIDWLPTPPPTPVQSQQQLVDSNGKPIGPAEPAQPGFLARLFNKLQAAAELKQQLEREEDERRKRKDDDDRKKK